MRIFKSFLLQQLLPTLEIQEWSGFEYPTKLESDRVAILNIRLLELHDFDLHRPQNHGSLFALSNEEIYNYF